MLRERVREETVRLVEPRAGLRVERDGRNEPRAAGDEPIFPGLAQRPADPVGADAEDRAVLT